MLFSTETSPKNQETNNTDNDKGNGENSPEKTKNDTETVDDSPEKAHEFICRVIEDSSRNGEVLVLIR